MTSKKLNSSLLLKYLTFTILTLGLFIFLLLASKLINIPEFFSYKYLFNNESLELKAKNFLVLLHISMFIFLLVLISFYNLRNQRLNIRKNKYYLPWFIIYNLYFVLVLILAFVWNKTSLNSLVYQSLLFIGVYLINLSYSIYGWIVKKEVLPTWKKYLSLEVISYITKAILLSTLIILLYVFTKNKTASEVNNLFVENNLINWFNKTLINNGFLGYLLLFLLVVIFITLIIVSYLYLAFAYSYKKEFLYDLKYIFNVIISILISFTAWFMISLFTNKYQNGVFNEKSNQVWISIIFIVITIGILTFIGLSPRILKTRNQIISYYSIITFALELLLAIIWLIIKLSGTSQLVNSINLGFFAINLLIVYGLNKKVYKTKFNKDNYYLLFVYLSLLFSLITQQLNVLLASYGSTQLSLTQTAFDFADLGIMLIIAVLALNLIIKGVGWIISSTNLIKQYKKQNLNEKGVLNE
ncbi:hypothetical protein FJO69_02020 [[Mycoplasma] falconis]|uniref:Uncharacterized protein n=1 Tax=[Mycoplasma] falconis TaxID=92403 RepID=A0A501XAA6_9BACT|nr:hypothetical protein [[Mycoplasma] falconis]TPE57264.1 hypothetical protein FJO69_02020 [[Mycoplasma] falconis]